MADRFMLDTSHWYIVRLSFLLAGFLVLLSALLALVVHPLFVLLGAFVGLMLVAFATTGFCPGAIIMDTLGVPRS